MWRTATALLGITAMLAVATPASAAKPSRSSCTVPASDLCPDFVAGRGRWSGTVVYYVNPAGAPAGFVEAVNAAFGAWETEQKSAAVEAGYPGDGSRIDFTFGGITTRVPFKRDGVNVVGMTGATSCDHCAGTSNTTSGGGSIVESDIGFDPGPGTVWSTDLSCPAANCGTYDMQGVATHEIGHLLGLFHVDQLSQAELTMSPRPRRDDVFMRTLGAGDVLGVRKLYP